VIAQAVAKRLNTHPQNPENRTFSILLLRVKKSGIFENGHKLAVGSRCFIRISLNGQMPLRRGFFRSEGVKRAGDI